MTIMYRARFDKDRLSGRAGMQRAMAVITLQSLLRNAHQHFIMIVRIVSMAIEMGLYAFDAGFAVATQIDPVAGYGFWHGSSHTDDRSEDGAGINLNVFLTRRKYLAAEKTRNKKPAERDLAHSAGLFIQSDPSPVRVLLNENLFGGILTVLLSVLLTS